MKPANIFDALALIGGFAGFFGIVYAIMAMYNSRKLERRMREKFGYSEKKKFWRGLLADLYSVFLPCGCFHRKDY